MNEKKVTIKYQINFVIKKTLTGIPEEVTGIMRIKDQYAILSLPKKHKKMLKKMYKHEKRIGSEVSYNEELNLLIERFEGKSQMEVAAIIAKQIKKEGGEMIEI